jgi:hypothetical protein
MEMMLVFGLTDYYNDLLKENKQLYNSHLYNEGKSALKVEVIKPEYE